MVLKARQRTELMAELAGLKRFCLSLTGDVADADDLLQLTVERVLERGMPADAHVAKWSYRVCRNIWLDELRSREVRQRYAATAVASEGVAAASADDGFGRVELERVDAAMQALPEEQRSALLLVAVEGRSYAEVSEILDIPLGTVMSRVARARRGLAEKLE
jgi:RNA polymerase sigma-70 factor (ECF subfamily)